MDMDASRIGSEDDGTIEEAIQVGRNEERWADAGRWKEDGGESQPVSSIKDLRAADLSIDREERASDATGIETSSGTVSTDWTKVWGYLIASAP